MITTLLAQTAYKQLHTVMCFGYVYLSLAQMSTAHVDADTSSCVFELRNGADVGVGWGARVLGKQNTCSCQHHNTSMVLYIHSNNYI